MSEKDISTEANKEELNKETEKQKLRKKFTKALSEYETVLRKFDAELQALTKAKNSQETKKSQEARAPSSSSLGSNSSTHSNSVELFFHDISVKKKLLTPASPQKDPKSSGRSKPSDPNSHPPKSHH